MKKYPKLLKLIVGSIYALFLLFITWLVWKNRQLLLTSFSQADYRYLFSSTLGYLVGISMMSLGWSSIMRDYTPSMSWQLNAAICYASLAARNLPGKIWHIGGRLALYDKVGVSRGITIFASSIEYVLLCLSGVVVGLCLLVFSNLTISLYSIGFLLVILLCGLIFLHPSVLKLLVKTQDPDLRLKLNHKHLLAWIWPYLMTWACSGFVVDQIVRMFIRTSGSETLFIYGSVIISYVLSYVTFFIPMKIGLSDITLVVLLNQIMPFPVAVSTTLVLRVFGLIIEIIISMVFIPISLKQIAFFQRQKDLYCQSTVG